MTNPVRDEIEALQAEQDGPTPIDTLDSLAVANRKLDNALTGFRLTARAIKAERDRLLRENAELQQVIDRAIRVIAQHDGATLTLVPQLNQVLTRYGQRS